MASEDLLLEEGQALVDPSLAVDLVDHLLEDLSLADLSLVDPSLVDLSSGANSADQGLEDHSLVVNSVGQLLLHTDSLDNTELDSSAVFKLSHTEATSEAPVLTAVATSHSAPKELEQLKCSQHLEVSVVKANTEDQHSSVDNLEVQVNSVAK